MPQTVISTTYFFPDADLIQKAGALLVAIKRDMNRFATHNINKESLFHFKQLIDAFANTCSDERLLRLCKMAKEEKDQTASILRRLLRSIHNMAELAFGGKGHFHAFGFEDMSEMNDYDLCVLAKRVRRAAYHLMPELAPLGITDSHLEALASFETALGAKAEAYNAAVENRDIEAQGRIQKGNAVYAELMRLASVGQSLYEEVGETRYNDYVMIGGNGSADKPQKGIRPEAAVTQQGAATNNA
jgi:hypothetical protein